MEFQAIVNGAAVPAAWTVNGGAGSPIVGTITQGGLYTAPAQIPNPATVTVSVTVNGQTLNYTPIENSIGWRYDGNILTTVVTLPRAPVTSSVTIQIRRTPELVARRNELDGFAGAMTRLRESYDTLNQTWPLGWSPDELIDAMQSGDRLTYHPESASKEIAHYREVLPQAQGQVQALTKGFSQEQMEKIATRVGQDWKSDAAKKKITEYNDRVGRALAQIGDINNGAQSQAAARGAQ